MVISDVITVQALVFFHFPVKFLTENHQHPKGNNPSKFRLIRVCRFGGDSEQRKKEKKHTDKLAKTSCSVRR